MKKFAVAFGLSMTLTSSLVAASSLCPITLNSEAGDTASVIAAQKTLESLPAPIQFENRSPAVKVKVLSALGTILTSYLSWRLTGLPAPTHLPALTFANPQFEVGYRWLRRIYTYGFWTAGLSYLALNPHVARFAIDFVFTPSEELAQHQEAHFDLDSARQKLWESWRTAFTLTVGREPNPFTHPEDKAEWDREWSRIQALTPEQIKAKFL